MSPALAVVCSLGCALTWAFASVTFARVMRGHESVAPQGLNLVKGAIALPFFIVFCVVSGAGLPPIDEHFGWLALSAVLGLLVADTGYFFALKRLGAARGVLFIPLVPVATSLLAAATLGEQLTIWSAVGMALTLVGLVVVLLQPASSSESSAPASSSTMLVGLVGGGIYALSQAAANVATKHVLNGAVVVHVATIRIGVGAVCLFFASWATGALPGLRPLFSKKVFGGVVAAALIGTLGGIWLGTLGAKVLPVGVSTTLAATTPLWALLLSRLSGESVPLRSFVGAVIAVAGVVVLASAQVE